MTKNIYQKLKSASEEARMVRKTQKKGGMNFNPLEHDAVQAVAMEVLNKNGLYPYCTYKDFNIQDMFVQTTCKMTIVDVDNPKSFIEIETHAIAQTNKYGSGNCMSYARKYAFLNALNLRTGMKDDEVEAKDNEDGYNADPLYKATAKEVGITKKQISLGNRIEVIEVHLSSKKPDLTTVKKLIMEFKSDNRNDYENFIKSEIGKRLVACENKLTKLKTNRR
ncbi:Putative single strand-annealing protein [uncultured Mediterranean phage uvMED]|nr:Putative single strand-annealing protein [uncultured Mediterranean phage uvMED]